MSQAGARALPALGAFGLASRRASAVRTLSQGQRRRGALARLALDEQPGCWLLDEPYDALDTASAASLTALMQAHAARGGSVVLTSHQPPPLACMREFDLTPYGEAA